MIAEIKGDVLRIEETKTKKTGRLYRIVEVLQKGDRGSAIVRVNLWNGQKVEVGKAVALPVSVRCYVGSGGVARLSADVF